MVYTGAPATVTADALKFLIGDLSTSSSGELLKSAECSYLLGLYGSPRAAAPHAARAVAAMFADQVNKYVGDLRIEARQKFEQYSQLAKDLTRSASIAVAPYVGGVSVSDKSAVVQDSDRVAPAFTVGMHDTPGLPQGRGSTST